MGRFFWPTLCKWTRIMPADSNATGLVKLLVLLEAAEQELEAGSAASLRRLAGLHEEAKAAVEDSHPQVLCENPIGARIFLAMRKGRDQGS